MYSNFGANQRENSNVNVEGYYALPEVDSNGTPTPSVGSHFPLKFESAPGTNPVNVVDLRIMRPDASIWATLQSISQIFRVLYPKRKFG